MVYSKKCHKPKAQFTKLQTWPWKKASVIQFEQHKESEKQKKEYDECKVQKKGQKFIHKDGVHYGLHKF